MNKFLIVIPSIMLACSEPPSPPPNPPRTELAGLQSVGQVVRTTHPSQALLVTASGLRSGDGPVLRFRVTNVSSSNRAFYRSQLPWGNSNTIQLAVTTLDGIQLPVIFPIDDPGPAGVEEPLVLKPGESLEGDFQLAWRVEDLEAHASDHLVVSWAFPSIPPGAIVPELSSGVAVIPREGGTQLSSCSRPRPASPRS